MHIRIIFIILTCISAAKLGAQSACGSGPISMQQLRILASPHERQPSVTVAKPLLTITPILYMQQEIPVSTIFLPQWKPADLPVFCRIEHEMGKKMPVMVKFRLGSVEYVDWLEGKGDKL